MGSIRSAMAAMGYTLAPPVNERYCARCAHGSAEQRRVAGGLEAGWWCALGQFWVRRRATCQRYEPADRGEDAAATPRRRGA